LCEATTNILSLHQRCGAGTGGAVIKLLPEAGEEIYRKLMANKPSKKVLKPKNGTEIFKVSKGNYRICYKKNHKAAKMFAYEPERAKAGAVIRINGSAEQEPEPKQIFKAPQHCFTQRLSTGIHIGFNADPLI
jgi:hypothetical protein